jgi:Zn-dependent protease/CBS domain-containing protein
MRGGIRIGKLFGIQLTLDLSWIVVFLLVSWNLTMVFATWHPGWPMPERLTLAVVAALLFFASVVAHELAHSLVAQSYGIPVSEIRLFLFGGVSNLADEPPSPIAEFLTAIVGPITSIGFGATMLFIGSLFAPSIAPADVTGSVAMMGPLPTLLLWLGAVNVGVGVFNLIPGFPLDGGRVLRAIIWSLTRNLRQATLWASTVGQATGWLFITMGVAMFFGVHVPFFGRGAAGGLWLAFIGWFLTSAARSSYRGVFLHEALEGVAVRQLMRRVGETLPAQTTIADAVAGWFMRGPSDAYIVTAGDDLVGLLTASDVRKVPREAWATSRVSEVMTPVGTLTTTTPTEDAAGAVAKLALRGVDQLPVVAANTRHVVGLLDRRDVARWLELRLGPTLQHRHV